MIPITVFVKPRNYTFITTIKVFYMTTHSYKKLNKMCYNLFRFSLSDRRIILVLVSLYSVLGMDNRMGSQVDLIDTLQ